MRDYVSDKSQLVNIKAALLKVAGEIRELTNLRNLRNKTQEIRDHVWEKTDSALSQSHGPMCERAESGFSHTWQNNNWLMSDLVFLLGICGATYYLQ